MKQRHYLTTILGYDMQLTVAGDPAQPPVVLIHGIGVSSSYFQPLMNELTPDHRVYAPDLPGFGSSPKPRHRLTIEQYARIVLAWLQAEAVPAPLLLGHSMGCQVVMEMTRLQPDVSKKVVLVGPTVDAGRRRVTSQAFSLLANGLIDPPRTTSLVLRDYIRCGPRHYFRTVQPMMADTIEQNVAASPADILVIRGARDPVSPYRWAAELAGLAPRGRLQEIAGAGHVVQYAKAVEVAASLREFRRA